MATVQVLPCYNRHGYSVSLLLNGVRQLDAHTFCNDECLSLTDIRDMMAGAVVTNGTEFDGTFDDAVEGLLEYHPDLGDKELVKNIKEIVRDIYQVTGNTQSDYERVRDAVESEIKRVERTDKLRQ